MLWFNLLHSWEYLTKKPNENLLLALHVSFWEIMSLFTQNRLPWGKDTCATSNKHRSLTFQRTPSERFQWGYTVCKTVRAWCNLIAFLFPSNSKLSFRVKTQLKHLIIPAACLLQMKQGHFHFDSKRPNIAAAALPNVPALRHLQYWCCISRCPDWLIELHCRQ